MQETMKNKIEAALTRGLIRDYFDIEFLLKQGIPIKTTKKNLSELLKLINNFTEKDFKVTLGSILEPDMRKYYIKNKFNFLVAKITNLLQ